MTPAVITAATAADLGDVAALFQDYVSWLGIDLGYQDYAAELAALPGKYAPPRGALLIGRSAHGSVVGCVALRPLGEEGLCEMKRLYVAPEGRGQGLGRRLTDAVIAEARSLGYRRMVLDTVPKLTAAIALYEALGFRRIAAYYETPVAETVFYGLDLKA